MDDDFWTPSGDTVAANRTPLRVVRERDPATQEARRRLLQPEPRPRSPREPVVIGIVLAMAIAMLTLSYLGARNNSLFSSLAETEVALRAPTVEPAAPATTAAPLPATDVSTTLAPPPEPTTPPTTQPAAVAPPSLTDDFADDFAGNATFTPSPAPTAVDRVDQPNPLAANLASALSDLDDETPVLASGTVVDLDETPPAPAQNGVAGLSDITAEGVPDDAEEVPDDTEADDPAETVTALDANADFLNLVEEIFGVEGPNVVALENTATPASSTYAIEDVVRFEYKSRTIVNEHLAVLDKVVTLLERRPNVMLEVVGHTDSRGDADKNLALSQARADSVVAYLMYRGIDADRLSSEGVGEARPVASNDTEEGRRLNRRIRLFLDQPTE